MHLIKNIVCHCVNLLAGLDSSKVRIQEQAVNRFPASWIKDKSMKKLPDAPFSLTDEEILLADNRAKLILVLSNFDWAPRAIFNRSGGFKSHQWKQLATSGILKFCLCGMLGTNQRKTLFKLFDVIQQVCSDDIDSQFMDVLEKQVHLVLALLERDFPMSLQVIVFHLFHHLPYFLKRFGPVHSFWMFNFNSWLIRRCLNRRHPESTVIETYILMEWACFLELSGNFRIGTIDQLCHDSSLGESSQGKLISLTEEQMVQIKSYYLELYPEFRALIDQYKAEKAKAK